MLSVRPVSSLTHFSLYLIMCNDIEQPYIYTGYAPEDKHVHYNKSWYECEKAETEGRCADATPMKREEWGACTTGLYETEGIVSLMPAPVPEIG